MDDQIYTTRADLDRGHTHFKKGGERYIPATGIVEIRSNIPYFIEFKGDFVDDPNRSNRYSIDDSRLVLKLHSR